jgi:hypothetical protein
MALLLIRCLTEPQPSVTFIPSALVELVLREPWQHLIAQLPSVLRVTETVRCTSSSNFLLP